MGVFIISSVVCWISGLTAKPRVQYRQIKAFYRQFSQNQGLNHEKCEEIKEKNWRWTHNIHRQMATMKAHTAK